MYICVYVYMCICMCICLCLCMCRCRCRCIITHRFRSDAYVYFGCTSMFSASGLAHDQPAPATKAAGYSWWKLPCPPNSYMVVSLSAGTPIAGWFTVENLLVRNG